MTALINASTSSGVVVTSDTSGSLAIQNNGSTTMTVTGGAVGIGTASPSATLHVYGTNSQYSRLESSTYSTWQQSFSGNGSVGVEYATGQPYRWVDTSVGERMRIDGSGNLLIGTTDSGSGATAAKQRIIGAAANNLYLGSTSAGGWRITSDALNDSGTYYHIKFNENGTQRGSITSNGSITIYATTSDYRLKENVKPIIGALNKVSALKPVTYDWVESKTNGQGFIAHELQAVMPDAVVGEKDAIDLEGNPLYQQIDTSVLVATLTAAIQELKAELDATKAEVAALKGTV